MPLRYSLIAAESAVLIAFLAVFAAPSIAQELGVGGEPAAAPADAETAAAPGAESAVATDIEPPMDTEVSHEALRDPFWPVGWKPAPIDATAPENPKGPIRWNEAARKLEVTALSRGADGRYFAIVKDIGVVEKGDTLSVEHEGLLYRWRVKDITSRGIVPERMTATNQRGR